MKKTVKIINRKQAKLYMKNGLAPLDFYTQPDGTIVFVFDKEESFPFFIKWCNRELV